jgi:hypothetical protein
MYVVELLEQLSLTIDMEDIGLGLPESLARPESCEVVGGVRSVPLANAKTAHPLPAMEKSRDFLRALQPYERMHVIGHQDKSQAPAGHRTQQVIQDAQHKSFGLVEVEQPPALIDRKRNEEDVPLVGKSSSVVAHANDCGHFKRACSRRGERLGGLQRLSYCQCLFQAQVSSNLGHPRGKGDKDNIER